MNKEQLIDLDKEQLALLDKIIKQHTPNKTVWAYGSRVTWKANEISDLDLVVFDCHSGEAFDLKEAFEESDLLISVDVMDWDIIPDNFKENIKKKYVVLQEKTELGGWREVKLGNMIEVKHGYAFNGKHITSKPNSNILVTPGNFHIGGGFKKSKFKYFIGDTPEGYILRNNDIVITMTDLSKNSDTLGYVAKIPKSERDEMYLHNQRIGLVQFKSNELDREFCYWLMRTTKYHQYIVSAASGTSIRHTSPAGIKEYTTLLPPLPEQKAIAAVLSSLDEKIDLLHRQNKTLEDMAQTLFRQWFVEEKNEKWKKKPLDQIADYLNGLACQKYPPKNETEKLPVLKIKELGSGISENSDWATSKVAEKYVVERGDIIFSWSGSLMVKLWGGSKCVLNQHLFKVSSSQYPKWYIYLWTKHHINKFIQIADSKATTMGHIKRDDLANAMALVPQSKEIETMNEAMTPNFEKVLLNFRCVRTLEILRDILLPKLVNGIARVKYIY